MPLKEAPLSKWCEGPASLCDAVQCDCSECESIHKERAEKIKEEEERKSK